MSPLAAALALPVRGYRLLLSPWVGHGCRFQPTCSAYALEALETHGGAAGRLAGAARGSRAATPGADRASTTCPPTADQPSTFSKKMITSPRSTPKRDT